MGKSSLLALLLIGVFSFNLVFGPTTGALADLDVSEVGLNPSGGAYEINPDAAGHLWITDYTASEVWGVDRTTGAYDVYPVGGHPVDARHAGEYLLWADGLSNILGRVSTGNPHTFTQWQVPDASGFSGTYIDDQGRLYATDSSNPYLYRLDPITAKLCTYVFPGLAGSTYIVRNGDYLWTGDWFDSRIFRLNVADNSLTWWQLSEGSFPFGMVVDGTGNLWFADNGQARLDLLDPSTNQMTSYALPTGTIPQMVTIQSGVIWYTEQSLASIGRLDPSIADHTHVSLTVHNETLTPTCDNISPSNAGTLTITNGTLIWGSETYTTILDAGGWQIFKMPNSADPWGIAISNLGYVVDTARHVLSRFNPVNQTTLVVIKHVINDNGGTAVTGDFTITVDDPGTNPPSFPAAESPGTGVTVDPGAYSVTENGPSGYTASYSADCTGTLAYNQSKTCTITNDDNPPALHLRKTVINDNGGTAPNTAWTLSAAGPTPFNGTTPVDSGATFSAGTYTLSESGGPNGYTASPWSCVGGSQSSSQISLKLGESATCTITNDDIAAGITKIYLPIALK